MDMGSFYGGQPGQDFIITYIFTSKNGATESLKSDLQRGWQSLIPVGSIVAVSYGLPGDTENFEENKKKDIDAENMTYNSTLWRKEYSEDGTTEGNGLIYTIDAANGLRYRLIASMIGNVPSIRVHANNNLPADQPPKAEIGDGSNADSPLIEFSFPVQQLIALGEVHKTGPNGKVDVTLDTEDINHPKLNFWLPETQIFGKVHVVIVPAGTPDVPKVEIITKPEEGISEASTEAPVLKFTLPQVQEFLAANITHTVVPANEKPSVATDLSDPNHPKITFKLPQAQVFGTPQTQIIAPDGQPQVSINSKDPNAPILQFQLPRGVEFYYGDKVGAREEPSFQVDDPSFTGYGIGDYYIHKGSGYIYKVIGVDGTNVTFSYMGCFQTPEPKVTSTPLDAFTEGQPTKPTVKQEASDEGWSLELGLPKGPTYAVNEDFIVGPADAGSVDASVTDNNTLTFSFKIPRGSRMFTGAADPEEVGDAKNGDYYLNTATGDVFTYSGEAWSRAEGNLRGPTGKTLNIVADYHITVGEEILDEGVPLADTLADGVKYIKYKQGAEKVYSSDEIYSITWVDEEVETAYWYYFLGGDTWGRVQLTGGSAGLIVDAYSTDAGKAYNTVYINGLIGNTDTNKQQSAYSKEKIEELLSWGSFSDLAE